MSAPKPCRVCGGPVTQPARIRKQDWICTPCRAEAMRERRAERESATLEELRRELDRSQVYNGRLRLRIYDLERAFRRAKEEGLDIPDPDDYTTSGSEFSVEPDQTETGVVPLADSEGE